MAIDRIIRLPELLRITGVSKTTTYRWCALSLFPRPISLGPSSVGWRESEVREWIESRVPVDSPTAAGMDELPEARRGEERTSTKADP